MKTPFPLTDSEICGVFVVCGGMILWEYLLIYPQITSAKFVILWSMFGLISDFGRTFRSTESCKPAQPTRQPARPVLAPTSRRAACPAGHAASQAV